MLADLCPQSPPSCILSDRKSFSSATNVNITENTKGDEKWMMKHPWTKKWLWGYSFASGKQTKNTADIL